MITWEKYIFPERVTSCFSTSFELGLLVFFLNVQHAKEEILRRTVSYDDGLQLGQTATSLPSVFSKAKQGLRQEAGREEAQVFKSHVSPLQTPLQEGCQLWWVEC